MKTNYEELVHKLEESGDYKVSKKLYPRSSYNADDGSEKKIGVFLDVETTGLDCSNDEIIELGMAKFEFNSGGKIFKILEEFDQLQEPKGVISEKITSLTGITSEKVKGHSIDHNAVAEFVTDASIIISHNAIFDRRMVEPQFPIFQDLPWGCSIADVSWEENEFGTTKLEYLAYRYGYFYDAHRASSDCRASIHLLTQILPISGKLVLEDLLENARKPRRRIYAIRAPYGVKNQLKENGYTWNGEYPISDTKKGVWFHDVEKDRTSEELDWLRDNYGVIGKQSVVNPYNNFTDRIL